MGFVKSFEEILASRRETADFYDAEMLAVFWETKPEIVARLLPPPLKCAEYPLAYAFVAHYPRTNFDVTYHESALFLRAVYNGEEGGYCLAMPVTSDMAMAGGREKFGFPKKMAEIHFAKEQEIAYGWTERRGVRFMEIRAKLTGKFNRPEVQTIVMNSGFENGEAKGVSFNFKNFPAPEGDGFDYNPRLVRQETVLKPKQMQIGEAEIILRPSDYDPWAEVEVVKALGAIYSVGDNSMLAGKTVAEVNPMQFAPHAFLKWDMK
ncbi:MAG: acetoacetate decarboxylase family protein [Syntrophobacteraceae bacterium]|jgi:acetoacetate decarboxylase